MRIGKIENGTITAIWGGDGISKESFGVGTFVELPEDVTYNVGDAVDAVELKGQLISKRDLLEMLFRLSNEVRVLQGQAVRARKAFLKFLGGLT